MRAISDSSPLIALHCIGRLDLLPKLFTSVAVPPGVASEIRSFRLPEWVRIVPLPRDPAQIAGVEKLGLGEAETIQLAAYMTPDRVLLDDAQARRLARRLGLRITGVLGLLLAAREQRLVESIRHEMEGLIAAGFHVSKRLYDALLSASGD